MLNCFYRKEKQKNIFFKNNFKLNNATSFIRVKQILSRTKVKINNASGFDAATIQFCNISLSNCVQ